MALSDIYVKPESGDSGEYDPSSHRWLLAVSEIAKSFPALTDEERAKKQKAYSLHVYSWYRKYCVASCNWSFAEWALACTAEGKTAVLDALRAQMEADAESGLDGVGNQVTVDFVSGVVLDQDKVDNARISSYAKDVLENLTISLDGAEMMLFKRYDLGYRLPVSRYADWGY